MNQVTVKTLLESRYGAQETGNILQTINDSYKKGTINAAVEKKSEVNVSGIVHGFAFF